MTQLSEISNAASPSSSVRGAARQTKTMNLGRAHRNSEYSQALTEQIEYAFNELTRKEEDLKVAAHVGQELLDKYERSLDEIERLESIVKEAQSTTKKAEESYKSLRRDHDHLLAVHSNLELSQSELVAELASAKESNKSARTRSSSIADRADADMKQLENELEEANSKVSDLNRRLRSSDTQRKHAEEELSQILVKLENAREMEKQLETLRQKRRDYDELYQTNQGLKWDNEQLSNTVHELSAAFSRLRAQYEEVDDLYEAAQEEVIRLKADSRQTTPAKSILHASDQLSDTASSSSSSSHRRSVSQPQLMTQVSSRSLAAQMADASDSSDSSDDDGDDESLDNRSEIDPVTAANTAANAAIGTGTSTSTDAHTEPTKPAKKSLFQRFFGGSSSGSASGSDSKSGISERTQRELANAEKERLASHDSGEFDVTNFHPADEHGGRRRAGGTGRKQVSDHPLDGRELKSEEPKHYRNADREFFKLTALSIKVNMKNQFEDVTTIGVNQLYDKAQKYGIVFHEYASFIQKEFNLALIELRTMRNSTFFQNERTASRDEHSKMLEKRHTSSRERRKVQTSKTHGDLTQYGRNIAANQHRFNASDHHVENRFRRK
jgi:hypothetical protein